MKIICIGRNYLDHAKELNNDVPTTPLFFNKPDSAILPKRNPFYIPDFTNEVHHEIEFLVRINRLGKHIEKKFAHKYYNEVSVGIDFTARDVQQKLKQKEHPWELAKAFDGSAVIGKFIPKTDLSSLENTSFTLKKNGDITQKGTLSDMIFSIDDIISYVSQFMTLKIGDVIFTGTPSGVSKVNPNDLLEGYLGEKKLFEVRVK